MSLPRDVFPVCQCGGTFLAYGVGIGHGVKVVRYRCDKGGEETQTTEPDTWADWLLAGLAALDAEGRA